MTVHELERKALREAAISSAGVKTYHCGTLAYTRRGLVVLFAWLLWGDFCFTLMETVTPSILPLKLTALGAPNWILAVIINTLPGILNMTVCPWVSFKSDRHRGRWGRRIPFILFTLPFLCFCLTGMGWSEDLGALVRAWLPPLRDVAPATVVITLLAAFMVAFSFFNLFVNSVFWYLFNDVVPARFLGRFFGLFRMTGTLAGAVYYWFVFQFAESHMREIFTGAALLYFIGFGLVCLRIKEGEYPPPPPVAPGSRWARLKDELRDFAKDSFSHRFYIYFQLMVVCGAMSGTMGIFGIFFSKDMGLTLNQIGKSGAVSAVATMVAMYFAAIFVDRWHPLRITTYMAVFGAAGAVFTTSWLWLAVTPPPVMYFWLGLAGIVPSAFAGALSGNASLPTFMRLLPPSRYGQFCGVIAMIRSTGTVLVSLVAGLAMDGLLWLCHGSNYAYRFIFIYSIPWTIVATVFTVLLYRQWKKLGGDEGYNAPAAWMPDGREPMPDGHISVPFRPRWLAIALHLFTAQFALQAMFIPVFLVLLAQSGMTRAFWWNFSVFLPATLLLLGAWLWQAGRIRRDWRDAAAGLTPVCGVPHHGVLVVMAIQGILMLPLNWAWHVWSWHLELERDIVWYGLLPLLALTAVLAAIHVLRLVERPMAVRVS